MKTGTASTIHTLELVAWDLDDFPGRPQTLDQQKLTLARELVSRRHSPCLPNALCNSETSHLRPALNLQMQRADLHAEMLGLDWSLGVVDLRCLLAFQRRLSFASPPPASLEPIGSDWDNLMTIAFAMPKAIFCDLHYDSSSKTITLRSENPNLQLRVTENASSPIAVSTGSPFFEVATYANRWFLRDGYHRAYCLLRAGIFGVPAVIVRARSLEELGACEPRFFAEPVLFSDRPPFVTDFLDDNLVWQYDRPSTIKTLRITTEESVETTASNELSGD